MIWQTHLDYAELSEAAAKILLDAIARNPRTVLGLPTGRTPVGMYERVVAACGRAYHCFREVVTFNLDEYVGPSREYYHFMKRNLFDHVDINPENTHIPDGAAADLDAECARYEQRIATAGGLGITFLGLGGNGHIAFNEPGTSFASRTHVVPLSEHTRAANATRATHAITMGIGTILESREIVLLASGETKRGAIERLRTGEKSVDFPASALWTHPSVRVLVA